MHSRNLLLSLGLVAQLASAQQPTQTSHPNSLSVLRRDGAPTASCPEQLGIDPMSCDDPACGGQSDTAGVCKNNSSNGKPCQCRVAASSDVVVPAPMTTAVTTTNAQGSTIIGIYDLITLDQYKSLKQSQTVTLTHTTTGTDGIETPAAAAAVVAAGGVLWLLGTGADAVDAALLASKAPAPPEANKDDPGCPAEKHKCKDCGAISGINMCIALDPGCGCDPEEEEKKCPATPAKCDDSACAGKDGTCTKGDPSDCPCTDFCPTGDQQPKCSDDTGCKGIDDECTTGDHKGCACKSCPTGDDQPQCDDEQNCKGENGKCTLGDNKGCGCKENSCPEERYAPYCDACGDKGDDGKCKGITDHENLFKGCSCLDVPADPPTWPSVDQTIINFDANSLPDISPDSYSYAGNQVPKCQNLGWGAKQDELKKSINDWCKSVDGKKVTKTGDGDTLYKRFGYSYYSYWLGAQYDSSGGGCGDTADITEIHCVSTMLDLLNECNAGQPTFNGAELTDGCTKYQVTFSTSLNDDDPPFKALPQKSPECAREDADTSEVAYNFWLGVSKKFCQDVGDGKAAMKEDLKNTDLVTRSLSRRTPPPSTSSYPDWKFHFEWAPENGLCASTCDEAMQKITDQCGHYGGQSNSMVKKGSLDVGCGTYSYELDGPPPKDTSAPPDGTNKQCVPGKSAPMGFDRTEAMDTIVPQFCGQDNVDNQMFGKDSQYPTLDFRSTVYPDMMVNLAITRINSDDCTDKTSTFVLKDRCVHLMGGVAVDACSTDTRTDKMGGTVDDGCVTYSIKSSKYTGDFAHGTCSVGITQYYDGTDYKIDGVLKDDKGGLLSQCINEKAALNSAVLCQTGNHSMLPKMMQITQRQDGTMSVLYTDTTFSTTDSNCKGGQDKFKDGKRSITCTWTC